MGGIQPIQSAEQFFREQQKRQEYADAHGNPFNGVRRQLAGGRQAFALTALTAASTSDIGLPVVLPARNFATVIELEILGVLQNNGAASARSGRFTFTATAGVVTLDVLQNTSIPVDLLATCAQFGDIVLPAGTAVSIQLRGVASNNNVVAPAGAWRWWQYAA